MARGVVAPGADSDLHPEDEELRRTILYEGVAHEGLITVVQGRMELSAAMAARGGDGALDLMVDGFEELVDKVLPYTMDEPLDDRPKGPGTWNSDFAAEHRKIAEAIQSQGDSGEMTKEEFLGIG